MSKVVKTVIVIGLLASPTLAQQSSIVSGFLTDTLSGRVGAAAQHAEASKRNVATGKAKYALYDEATKKLYVLACAAPPSTSTWATLDQSCVEPYLGQRLKITGTLTAAPITRAGRTFAPDAVAAPKDAAGNADQSSTTRTVMGDPTAPSGQGPARVQSFHKAQDTSTPVAGILVISSVEVLSSPSPQRTP